MCGGAYPERTKNCLRNINREMHREKGWGCGGAKTAPAVPLKKFQK